jgi:major membrane immunogen (membrane-anchored lipoprotein)
MTTDEMNKYIDNIKDKDLEKVDTVSGATVSSTALKELLKNVLENYGDNYE